MADDQAVSVGQNTEEYIGGMTQLERLMYWSPAALFAFALAFAAITAMLNPTADRQRRRDPQEYYFPAVRALAEVQSPTEPLTPTERERLLLQARVGLRRLIWHYRGELDAFTFEYMNPYLLLAETNRLLGDVSDIPRRANEFRVEAARAYDRAEVLELRERTDPKEQRLWNRQYQSGGPEIPGRDEAAARKKRRLEYIRFQRAVVHLALGHHSQAERGLESLRDAFFQDEMELLRAEKQGLPPPEVVQTYPIVEYELRSTDKDLLHYYLGRVYDEADRLDDARREYQLFLLDAPRGRERFAARMRLAGIAYDAGLDARDLAEDAIGAEREALRGEAEGRFRAAADAYAEVVEASPPVDFLQDAFFRGGKAYLAVASVMDVGRTTTWDVLRREGRRVRGALEHASGRPLPERVERLPQLLGRALVGDAGGAPDPFASPVRMAAGGLLHLAGNERQTPKDDRDRLLRRARNDFFDMAARTGDERIQAAAMTMIARSLLLEDRPAEARKLLTHVMESFPFEDVRIGSLWGLGISYLDENRLDEAWQAFDRLPAGQDLPVSELLDPREVQRDLDRLARAYVERAESLTYPVEWVEQAAPGSMQWTEAVRRAREQRRALIRAVEVYEALQARYPPDGARALMPIARLYARRADLLLKRPFGGEEEKLSARDLRMRAADTFESVALRDPASPNSEEALLEAGGLFFAAKAYERAVESYGLFLERHGRSERASEVRNQLGLSYLSLGLYRRAEEEFRLNAGSTSTAEGMKSLYNLGRVYMRWALTEPDREHLGGPQSPLVLSKQGERSPEDFLLRKDEVLDWQRFVTILNTLGRASADSPARRLVQLMGEETAAALRGGIPGQPPSEEVRTRLLGAINELLVQPSFYDPVAFRDVDLGDEAVDLLRRGLASLTPAEVTRLNRRLLTAAFPELLDPGKLRLEAYDLPRTAEEVFAYLRRRPGIGPESRPWRWATFSLGETYYRIARSLMRRSQAPAPADGGAAGADEDEAEAAPTAASLREDALGQYRRAQAVLREALNRYQLYNPDTAPFGFRRDEEPVDYVDVHRSRFRASYFLALTEQALGREDQARRLLAGILDEQRFGPELFAMGGEEARELRRMHRNAYFFLGMSLFRDEFYEQAYSVYETAQDRLKTSESPYIIYMMGECLRAMGRLHEARNKYIQARHAALSAPPAEEATFADAFGKDYWAQVNDRRIADLDYLREARGERVE